MSAKYDWVEHEQGYNPSYTKRGRLIVNYNHATKYDNKAYRVFASKDENDGRLLKCKHNPKGGEPMYWTFCGANEFTGTQPNIKRDKFGNTPDHCFIQNGDIKNMAIPDKLDRQYYINLAKKRLEDFGL